MKKRRQKTNRRLKRMNNATMAAVMNRSQFDCYLWPLIFRISFKKLLPSPRTMNSKRRINSYEHSVHVMSSPLNYYSAQSTLSRSPWRDIDGGGQYTNCPLEQRPRGDHSRRRGRRGLNHEPQRGESMNICMNIQNVIIWQITPAHAR